MSSIHAQCPSNSTFFACDYGTRFLGCCLSTHSSNEVCGIGCPPSSLTSLSFDKQYYNRVTEGSCGSSEGKWYTCPDSDPPFLGCCKSNPCQPGGCPYGGLVPATLSENQAQQAAYAPAIEGPSSISSSTSRSSATSSSAPLTTSAIAATTVASTATAAVPSAAATSKEASSSAPSTPAIIGAVVGGLIGGILISLGVAASVIYYKRRKTQLRSTHSRKASDQLGIVPRSPSLASSAPCHEMSSEPARHELQSSPLPLQELASQEINNNTVHELPSPLPSPSALHLKQSTSSLRSLQHGSGNVSPLVGPYSGDGAAAVSEVSLPDTGKPKEI
ncbi:hypothetical protein ACLMJK_000013 [Lecanora helva]